ncbi:transmembrane transport [Geosmithia morbida]|uniref:Probable transporter MCH1 n=1 Tax=Geosmithia morbida TaxID=1094350 RepID=A0A9P4YN78_9HYPO|nr:transmembrane transport [Geosmithia morbida]KAF4119562.1 transmembrane transport [Geosmithia morbida]
MSVPNDPLATEGLRSLSPEPIESISDRESTLSARLDGDDPSDASYYQRRHRDRQKKQVVRLVAFVVANAFSLCAGSNVLFSMYAPLFQSRLHYTQLQVNGAAIACSVALYLPISIVGFLCDRYGAPPLALGSGTILGLGYGLAAAVYRDVDLRYRSLGKKPHDEADKTYPLMILAFVFIGMGTCAGYMSSVSTVAKNFGKGKYRGLALAMPITCFGLSGMWLSQVGSIIFYETRNDGSKGDVDVFRFFIFLAVLLLLMGILGSLTLRVVDEKELIDEAIEEMENSGLLDGSSLLGQSERSYGAVEQAASTHDEDGSFDTPKDDDAKWRKNWVLNAETRRFLSDHTMWPFAMSFLLMVGPGEAFINNLGTVIGTLSPPEEQVIFSGTSAATHVSVFGVTSTISRLVIGTLTDIFAPSPSTQHAQLGPAQHSSPLRRISISRVVFMLFFAILMAIGLLFLASGAAQNHADRFWVVSALVGAGYGAIFSLTPLIVTIIWGVENFATNFGIIATVPALGSVFWGSVFSAVYQQGARSVNTSPDQDDELFCYGKQCYASTFWAEGLTVLLACVLLVWAWKGRGGWQQRGIVI